MLLPHCISLHLPAEINTSGHKTPTTCIALHTNYGYRGRLSINKDLCSCGSIRNTNVYNDLKTLFPKYMICKLITSHKTGVMAIEIRDLHCKSKLKWHALLQNMVASANVFFCLFFLPHIWFSLVTLFSNLIEN